MSHWEFPGKPIDIVEVSVRPEIRIEFHSKNMLGLLILVFLLKLGFVKLAVLESACSLFAFAVLSIR